MNSGTKIIRDFIYLDVDRLYSLTSQVSGGVVAHIAESFHSEQSKTDSHRGLGKNLDERVAEAALRTENKILYDHLYNQLEESLAKVLVEPQGITPKNYREKLGSTFMVKVRGAAEISDYARLADLVENFNQLGFGIAYMQSQESGEYNDFVAGLMTEFARLYDLYQNTEEAEKKQLLEQQIGNFPKLDDQEQLIRAFAFSKQLQYNPFYLSSIKQILDLCQRDAFEVAIVPQNEVEGFSFRGVLDKQWLRLKPDYLRTLYGGVVNSSVVMTGQITHIPETVHDALPDAQELFQHEEVLSPDVTVRDAFQSIFNKMRNVDKIFFGSKKRTEFLVRPLAIYQEVSIPSSAIVDPRQEA